LSSGCSLKARTILSKDIENRLSLVDVSIGYKQPLLKNISTGFGVGLTGIIGNNGKGKTTFLKCLGGLLAPLAGSVRWNDIDIFRLSNASRARLVSFNFSSNPVSFPVSVHELVSMGRYPYTNHWAGLSAEDERIIDQALEISGISSFSKRMVNALSDGERQKAFIAKSIAQQTGLMLFDEPTAFLDYTSKKKYFALMRELAVEHHRVILISSHDIDFLISYADHIVMIGEDESVMYGPVSTVCASDYFKTHFTKL